MPPVIPLPREYHQRQRVPPLKSTNRTTGYAPYQTLLVEENTYCQWYPSANVCGRDSGCGLIGCGESSCRQNDTVLVLENGTLSFPDDGSDENPYMDELCENVMGCVPCLNNTPMCGWSTETDSCVSNPLILEDNMPEPESCPPETTMENWTQDNTMTTTTTHDNRTTSTAPESNSNSNTTTNSSTTNSATRNGTTRNRVGTSWCYGTVLLVLMLAVLF